jgi:hypothetical protein
MSILSLEKRIEAEAPQLLTLVKKAQSSIDKVQLNGHKAKVALCLDISLSMEDLYDTGKVQALADRVMALATRFDDDGILDIFLFGIKGHQPKPMQLSECGKYLKDILKKYPLELGTNYSQAIQLMRKYYIQDSKAGHRIPSPMSTPVYVMFITDGDTQNQEDCVQQMRLASYEPIFWQFMALGSKASDFQFLQKLDQLSGRYIDNASFFNIAQLNTLTDESLYDQMMKEYPDWLKKYKTSLQG